MTPVGQRARIAVLRCGDNGFRTRLFPVAAGEAGAGNKAFDAVRFAAVAGLRRAIALRSIARQRIMSPLSGDSVGAAEQLLMNGDPAAAAGTDNHPEDGGGAGATTVFGVIIGTGCGGGIAVHQQLLSGPNAIAGEWGHNPLPGYTPERDGPPQPCYCGKTNCIESFVSGTGFARRYGEQARAEAIVAAAQNGDPRALAHWRHFIDAFARSLASVINILDPQVIVLGGGLSNVSQIYRDLPAAIVPWIFSDTCRTQIKPARFGDASGVRGAAWLPRLPGAADGPR